MKYYAKYFLDNMPLWKKKNDPIVVRLIFRPLSFPISAFCANHGIKANYVTLISIMVAFVGSGLFFFPNKVINIIGGILINFWLLLDCVDGNLARHVQKQPFGEFLDALGSYILVAFISLGIGLNVYEFGGILISSESIFALVIGAISCICDLLMRLTYQKYKNTYIELQKLSNTINENKPNQSSKDIFDLKRCLKMELGIGGIVTPAILFCVCTGCLDLVLIYMFLYDAIGCFAIICIYIRKVMKYMDIEINID